MKKNIPLVGIIIFLGFQIIAPRAAGQMLFSDNFSGTVLDTNWIVISPNANSFVGLTGGGELLLSASPLNGGSDLYGQTNYNAPRIVQWVDTFTNWTVETKLHVNPTNNYQGAGFVVLTGTVTDSLQLATRVEERAYNVNQNPPQELEFPCGPIPDTDTVAFFRMRYSYTGHNLDLYYSADSISWTLECSDNIHVYYVGLFSIRQPWDDDTLLYTNAYFDYFHAMQNFLLAANAGDDTGLCLGDTAMLGGNPSAFGGFAPYTYLWQPATGLSSDTVANPLATPDTTTTYLLTITDSLGASNISYVTVMVNNPPNVTFSIPQDTFCSRGNIITLNGGSPAGGIYSGNGVTGNHFNPVNANVGMDTITYTDTVGCIGSAMVVAVVDSFPSSITLDSVQSYGITTIYAPPNAAFYIWQLQNPTYYFNFISPDADSIQVLCTIEGEVVERGVIDTLPPYFNNIRVVVSLAGCTDTSAWMQVKQNQYCLYLGGGIHEISALSNINIYPNPSDGDLNINYTLSTAVNLGINILDMEGRLLMNLANEKSSLGAYTQHVDISKLAAGMYMLNFVSEEGSLNKRFVKE